MVDLVRIYGAPRRIELAVQVENIGGPASFVKVIDILGNDRNVEMSFQFGKRSVRIIWLNLMKLPLALVVKIKDELWIRRPSLRCSDLLNSISFP